jgi:GntR family transcriptional regulator
MLHFQINNQAGLPVYRQLLDQIKYYIASGVLGPGDQLPSIRELAQTLAINPTTVVRVYSDLEHEGVIAMKQGKGAFVASPAFHMSQSARERKLRELARRLVVEAAQMGASAGQVLQAVQDELAELHATQQPENTLKLPRKGGR